MAAGGTIHANKQGLVGLKPPVTADFQNVLCVLRSPWLSFRSQLAGGVHSHMLSEYKPSSRVTTVGQDVRVKQRRVLGLNPRKDTGAAHMG